LLFGGEPEEAAAVQNMIAELASMELGHEMRIDPLMREIATSM
jgi:hypothetical protein